MFYISLTYKAHHTHFTLAITFFVLIYLLKGELLWVLIKVQRPESPKEFQSL